MTPLRSRWSADGLLRWSHLASIGTLAAGLLVLGVYCVAEAMANPGYSLIDAYWLGRLPWMGIAETLIVCGASGCAVLAGTTVFWLGGSRLRALAIPALLAVAFWWFAAFAMTSMRFAPCEVGAPCPTPQPDPWAYAYSVPEMALLMLILPGIFLTVLAIASRRQSQSPAPT